MPLRPTRDGFVIWNCGCVGLLIQGKNICIKPCDCDFCDTHGYDFFERKDLEQKNCSLLSNSEIEKLITDISDLIRDGYKFREIRSLLK